MGHFSLDFKKAKGSSDARESDYSEFWLGEVPRIAVNLRKIDIPAWVLAGNYEDDADFREQFQQWVDQLWTEKDQLIEKMKAKYSTSNLTE